MLLETDCRVSNGSPHIERTKLQRTRTGTMGKPIAGYSRLLPPLLRGVGAVAGCSLLLSCERAVGPTCGSATSARSVDPPITGAARAVVFGTPLASDEPVFRPGTDVAVFQDDFDEYTSFADMSNSAAHPQRFQPYGLTSQMSLRSPGYGGSGNYISAIYCGVNGERPFWTIVGLPDLPYTPASATLAFSYYARISGKLGDSDANSGLKWFEMWNVTGTDRTQFSLGQGNAATGPQWHVYTDQTGILGLLADPNVAYQPTGPYWNALQGDGNWHRLTYLYTPASGPAIGDGTLRMWVDGAKIVDLSLPAVGITPPGGDKPWCTTAQLVELPYLAIGAVQLPEYLNSSTSTPRSQWPITVDIDSFLWWVVK